MNAEETWRRETKRDISEWHNTLFRAASCCFDWTINHHSSPHSTRIPISNKLSHTASPGFRPQNQLARGSEKAWVGGFHSSASFSADITPSDKTVYTSKVSGTDWTEEVSFTNTHCKTIDAAEQQTAPSSSWEVLLIRTSVLWGLQFRFSQQFRRHATQVQEKGTLGVKLSDILQSLLHKLNKWTLVIIAAFLPV